MNKLLLAGLAATSLFALSSCETFDDDDDRHRHGGATTTTTTEQTTLSHPYARPYSSTVETQTTRSY